MESCTFPAVPEQELISFRDLVLPLKNTFFYGRTAVVASVVMIWVKSLVTEREALKKAKDKKTLKKFLPKLTHLKEKAPSALAFQRH